MNRQLHRYADKWLEVARPLCARLEAKLRHEGFGPHCRSGENPKEFTKVLAWEQQLFAGYCLQLALYSEAPYPFAPGLLGFSAMLFVASARQGEVEFHSGLNDCIEYMPGFKPTAPGSPTMLGVSLNWLMGGWDPVIGPFDETMQRWFNVPIDQLEAAADDVHAMWLGHGMAFRGWIDTPEKLARVVEDATVLPCSKKGSAPRAVNPSVHSAILYFDLGLPERALETMKTAEKQLEAAVAREEMPAGRLKTLRCQHDRLREWMSTQR